jgi:hypothetical protein
MRKPIIFLLLLQLCLIVRSHAADPLSNQRQYIQSRREGRQNLSPSQDSLSASTQLSQPRVVSIDRFKVQSDTPMEYQFEQVQTLSIQDGARPRVEEAKTEVPAETAAEEPQQEQPTEEVTASEPIPEEPTDAATETEGTVIQTGTGHASYRIIEEDNRIIVLQVEAVETKNR